MFRITEDPPSGSLGQCLAKNYKNDSIVSVDMNKVGVMAAYSDQLCVCVCAQAQRVRICYIFLLTSLVNPNDINAPLISLRTPNTHLLSITLPSSLTNLLHYLQRILTRRTSGHCLGKFTAPQFSVCFLALYHQLPFLLSLYLSFLYSSFFPSSFLSFYPPPSSILFPLTHKVEHCSEPAERLHSKPTYKIIILFLPPPSLLPHCGFLKVKTLSVFILSYVPQMFAVRMPDIFLTLWHTV